MSVSFDRSLFDGLELVYSRVTRGRHDLKRLKAYMDARGEMARTWVKAMKKASEQPELEGSSSIGNVWKEIKETGAAQMRQQEAFAAGCHEISQALEAQIVEVKKTKTALLATFTKLVADVKKKQQIHDKSKDVYYESVKQAETAVMNRDAAIEQRMADKAVQKAEARAKQTLKEVDSLHAAYQKAVQSLQEAQQQHDVTVVDLLQQFEKLERSRMRIFLDQLDRFAAQHDTLKTNMEQVAQSLHQQVTAVDIESDVQEFIKTSATGKPAAPHVEYIPCKSSIIDHAMDFKPNNAGSVPAAAAVFASSPATNGAEASASASSVPPSPITNTPSNAAPVAAASAAVVASSSFGGGSGETAVALYDFDQNEADDLAFKVGDVIKLISSPDNEDWWQGEKDGRTGIFPKSYVQKQSSGGAASTPTAAAAPPPQPPQSSNPFGDAEESAPAASAEGAPAAAGPGGDAPKLMDAQCAALFDFEGQDEDELSFKVGQILVITGELNGWYLGRQLDDPTGRVGIFPSNYVNLSQQQ